MIGIYKITSPSCRVYIGQSRNIEKRKIQYEKYIKESCRQVKLLASFKKYGFEKHIFFIIEECPFERLNDRERYWQEFYNSVEKGLNCLYTKTDTKPSVFSKKTRLKMSNSHSGKKLSNETKEKMRQVRLGYKFSDEAKKKISDAHKGKKYSDDTLNKMSIAAKNDKSKWKAISCISPVGIYYEFNNILEAANHIGVSPQSISNVLYKYKSKKGICKEWSNFKLIEIAKNNAHI